MISRCGLKSRIIRLLRNDRIVTVRCIGSGHPVFSDGNYFHLSDTSLFLWTWTLGSDDDRNTELFADRRSFRLSMPLSRRTPAMSMKTSLLDRFVRFYKRNDSNQDTKQRRVSSRGVGCVPRIQPGNDALLLFRLFICLPHCFLRLRPESAATVSEFS